MNVKNRVLLYWLTVGIIGIGYSSLMFLALLALGVNLHFSFYVAGQVVGFLLLSFWKPRRWFSAAQSVQFGSDERPPLSAHITPPVTTAGDLPKLSISEAILWHIRSSLDVNTVGSFLIVRIGTSAEARLMQLVLQHHIIPREDITSAVHDALCRIGREMWEWHRCAPTLHYPDHSLAPLALGYAIRHGALSSAEVQLIRFDHGETAEEYSKMAADLLEHVMQRLKDGRSDSTEVLHPSTQDCEGYS